MRKFLIGVALLAVSFFGALAAINGLWPKTTTDNRPPLAAVPPLQPLTRASVVAAPAEIALSAIRDMIEAEAPRNLAGKADNPLRDLLTNAEVGWTVTRGPLSVVGRSDALVLSTPLNGTFRITGQIGNQVGNLTGQLGNILGGDIGRQIGNVAGKAFDQRADVRGSVTITSHPTIAPNWRLQPNLTGQVTIGDAAVAVVGVRVGVPNQVKPMLDQNIGEQVAALEARVRNDPFLEQAARREWTQMCRSISLRSPEAGIPDLWLEIRPTRAFATQPRVGATAVTLVLGVEAQTRVVPTETKPNCPFPATVEIVPQMDQGRITIGVPIDLPFTEVDKVFEAQLKGKTFPEDGSGPVSINVRRAAIAPSGDRLLISLVVRVTEKKSWFGLGADATLHIWGRPTLDREHQVLRFTDLELAVESEAAFGLLGTAAQAMRPQLREALTEHALIDLKPFAASARKRIDAALGDFRQAGAGVRADLAVTAVRLVGVAFDAKTLRVIAEADGTAKIAVTALPVH